MLAIHGSRPIDIIRDTVPRWILQADLLALLDVLKASPLEDQITRDLHFWRERFVLEFRRHPDSKRVKEEFITLLQEILIDPFSHAPLDEEAVLGNDGITYSSHSLALHLHSVPEQYKHRSPMYPHNPAPFITQPHPVARGFIQWLKKNGCLLHSEELEQRYRALIAQRPVAAVLPDERSERIRRIREKQLERERARQAEKEAEKASEREFSQQVNQFQVAVAGEIEQAFAPVHQRIDEVAQEQLKRLDNLEATEISQRNILLTAADRLQERVTQLQAQNEALEQRIRGVDEQISEAEREDARLQVSINEVRQVLAARDSGSFGGMFQAIAIIGACALATWAIQGGIAAAGSSSTGGAYPINKGGMFFLSIAF